MFISRGAARMSSWPGGRSGTPDLQRRCCFCPRSRPTFALASCLKLSSKGVRYLKKFQ